MTIWSSAVFSCCVCAYLQDEGVKEDAFKTPEKLHLTLGVMRIFSPEEEVIRFHSSPRLTSYPGSFLFSVCVCVTQSEGGYPGPRPTAAPLPPERLATPPPCRFIGKVDHTPTMLGWPHPHHAHTLGKVGT